MPASSLDKDSYSAMKELIEFIARSLVDEPDAVKVTEIEGDQLTTYEIEVAPADVGKMIGRQGRIIKAIRSVVRASAARQGKRVAVEVV
jgi:predicted RNA-binding protein YlqC (UPF0109 family)